MNSCLYECTVMHQRLQPLSHKFVYRVFAFYLDLDEIDALAGRLRFFSRNRFNLFNFRDLDHLKLSASSVKENIREYLKTNGVDLSCGRIMLLTHLRTLGHVFNPVSFYFCFRADGRPECAIPEVGNTYGEMKPFFLGRETHRDNSFDAQTRKHFYVSPFMDLNIEFDWSLKIPDDRLELHVDDLKDGERILISSLTGARKELTDANLIRYFLRFPLITVKVIGAIHWQALRLYWKKLPYHRKADNPEYQKGAYRARNL